MVISTSSAGTTMGAPGRPERAEPEGDTWLLQRDAADAAGCSVSAIRKWRRLGLVADRTRVSAGGMRRIEVRFEDVLRRMQQSMPHETAPALERPVPVDSGPIAMVTVGDLDVFVQHIAEAERRAAQAEARSQAKDAMIQFLRQRVADMEAQLQRSPSDLVLPSPLNLERLVQEIRDLRTRFQESQQRSTGPSAARQTAARLSHDAALISLCLLVGIDIHVRLGEILTSPERSRLAHALEEAGLDISG